VAEGTGAVIEGEVAVAPSNAQTTSVTCQTQRSIITLALLLGLLSSRIRYKQTTPSPFTRAFRVPCSLQCCFHNFSLFSLVPKIHIFFFLC
jgi:hypothetical protein